MRRAILPILLMAACAMSATAATADGLQTRLAAATPIVCAHRGWLSPARPENSLRSMRDTEARGRFMLEMDLAVARDGEIVLMHDARVDRTTNGNGAVAALDWTELSRLLLRARNGDATNEAPPTLRAVLRWAAATPGTMLMLDLKRTPPALAMAAVRRAGMAQRVLLLCFDADTAAAAFASDPAVAVSVLARTGAELENARRMAGKRFFLAYLPLDRPASLFARARAEGVPVVTDLLDPHDALRDRFGVDALRGRAAAIVVSNHPVEIAAALSSQATPVR